MNQDAMRVLVERQMRAWMEADLNTIVADFAEDALFIAPAGRWQGRAAIRAAAEAFFAQAGEVQITLRSLIVEGDRGAIEWRWSERRRADGRRYGSDDAIIFAAGDGGIRYWREYFDSGELATPEDAARPRAVRMSRPAAAGAYDG